MKLYTEEQINELMVLLQQSFLPENRECDGAHCMGCWKDVVRETLKKMANLSPIELPSDEEIENYASKYAADGAIINGAKWMKEQILNQNK